MTGSLWTHWRGTVEPSRTKRAATHSGAVRLARAKPFGGQCRPSLHSRQILLLDTMRIYFHHVRHAMTCPLPGLPAQMRMAPTFGTSTTQNRTPPPQPKEAGVLILFYPREGRLFFPLTRRSDTVENHRGQISLPGGARESGERLQTTALRETCEELNVCAENLEIIGRLTPLYVPTSGFLINPFVAFSSIHPVFKPDPLEVAELIETPLTLLLKPATVLREDWILRGAPAQVPLFNIYGHKVWGATAMVLSELVALMQEAQI